MRVRTTLAIGALVVAAVGVAPTGVSAQTYTYSGTVTDYNGGAPLEGVIVTATPPADAGPDVIVATDASGFWSFQSDLDEYGLFFDGGVDYQSGYRGCTGVVGPELTCTFGPGDLDARMFATWIAGRILDNGTELGVAGAVVEVRALDLVTVLGSDTTGPDGSYRVNGLVGDEFAVFVNGAPAGYGSGWLGCTEVVPTWDAACSQPPGMLQDYLLSQVLPAPWFAAGLSLRPETILLIVLRPPGTVLGYELTCQNQLTGAVTMRTYTRSFESRSGFPSGKSACSVKALGLAGLGAPSRPFTVNVR